MLSTRKQVITIIIVDITIIMNKISEVCSMNEEPEMYVVGPISFRPDQLWKVTEMKQLCYFSI